MSSYGRSKGHALGRLAHDAFSGYADVGAETARAVAGVTARFAAGSGTLAELVRQRQDLLSLWQALDGALVKAVSQPSDKRNAEDEASLRKEIADVDAKLRASDEQLRSEFPRFAELASAKPVALTDVQEAVLGSDEALVAWTVGDDESYAFVVRKDRATFFRVPLKGKDLAEMVSSLRDSLDRRGRLPVEMPPFDTAKAYALYQNLLAPAESLLAGAMSVIIVPDGALQSLPPAVLVTEAPHAPIADVGDYRSVPWLARRYALTVGFGDPDFGGGKTESVQAQATIQPVSLFRCGVANIDGYVNCRRCRKPPVNCKPRRRFSARRLKASISGKAPR